MKNEIISNYLTELSGSLVLTSIEKDKIENSIKVIREKLILTFFDHELKEVRTFGSFDRGTLLTRRIDTESDIDILMVFNDKKWESQTYFNKLKDFANSNYPRSENYQDHPTIVIELNHIKFELVPCIYKQETFWKYATYLIPLKNGKEIEWTPTNPDQIKEKINQYGIQSRSKLVKLIVLFKYWNIKNNSLYNTLQVEHFVLNNYDTEKSLEENFFNTIFQLHDTNPKEQQNALNYRAKEFRKNIELLLDKNMEDYALMEMKKLLPSF